MTKFFYNFRKPYVWPINSIFGAKKFFQKISLVHAQLLKCFYHHVKLQKKLMVQFQGQTEGRKDRGTNRPFFKGPFPPMPRIQKLYLKEGTKYRPYSRRKVRPTIGHCRLMLKKEIF